MNKIYSFLQRIGKSLMLPIAVMPAAGLLLRLGAADVFNIPLMHMAGSAIFDNLPIIFAIGIAIGLADDENGAAGLSGAIGYLVLTNGLKALSANYTNQELKKKLASVVTELLQFNNDYTATVNSIHEATDLVAKVDMKIFAGIIVGIVAGLLYNKYKDVQFPDFLGFFSGKRFIPIVTSLWMIILALVFNYIWPPVQNGIDAFAIFISHLGALGAGIFGFVGRLLIPFGLHHIINTYIWFVFGEFTNNLGHFMGDIPRFLNGDPTAGMFQAGLFPIMMFGLPGACFAMILASKKENRKKISGLLMGAALTSFLTGITEPVEFTFIFISPLLFLIHAFLTGLSMALATIFNMRNGFSFSAGAIDFFINFKIAEKPVWLLAFGLAYGFLYFIVFYFAIKIFDIKTPGREDIQESNEENPDENAQIGEKLVKAFGGESNIVHVDACITRLRIEVKDTKNIDEAMLKELGAISVNIIQNNVQAVFGANSDSLATQMKNFIASNNLDKEKIMICSENFVSPISGNLLSLEKVPDEIFAKKVLGEGFAINPIDGIVNSPVDGEVLQVFDTKHAITIRAQSGLEILIHFGIDTVSLNGEGFESFVKTGDKVKCGDKLINADFDKLKEIASSLITPIVFINLPDSYKIEVEEKNIAVGDKNVFTITVK